MDDSTNDDRTILLLADAGGKLFEYLHSVRQYGLSRAIHLCLKAAEQQQLAVGIEHAYVARLQTSKATIAKGAG
ncbi:hypothetical protein [Caballeronia sp. HLA56]